MRAVDWLRGKRPRSQSTLPALQLHALFCRRGVGWTSDLLIHFQTLWINCFLLEESIINDKVINLDFIQSDKIRAMLCLQDLKHLKRPLSEPSGRSYAMTRACQQGAQQRERLTCLRRPVSEASTYDSACCLASPVEEEEEVEEEGQEWRMQSSPSSEKSLEFDSGYSEASWQDEGVVLRRTRNVRVSNSACLRTNRGVGPADRIRPKSSSDACLERWTSFEASSDPEDWTTSLLSCSRNRQPLVLGDNSFADLIKNWMDLPECPEPAELKPHAGRRLAKDLLINMRRKLAGMSKSVEMRARPADSTRVSRAAAAPKRMSCPVGFQPRKPFFHQSHTGLHELGTDFYQFNALMKTGSRQPIICNDIIGYI